MFVVAAFYHFFDFPDFETFRPELKAFMVARNILGTILLAPEGVNGTVSGPRQGIDELLALLRARPGAADMAHKEHISETHVFKRPKVKLKREIITFGQLLPANAAKGKHLNAAEWNALLADPDVIVLDARNHYESAVGTFENAVTPPIRTFTQIRNYVKHQLSDKKDKKIATFCTGGIRCEKFSAWMLEEGFEEVYQLEGGILKYLQDTPAGESRWQGECFVFDDREVVS